MTALARRCGVREQYLVAIERDAFEDLPSGLYGRNAVRAYATAVGVSPEEALAEVAPRLRAVEDPLDGLARVRGLPRQKEREPSVQGETGQEPAPRAAATAALAANARRAARDRWTAAKRDVVALGRLVPHVGPAWRPPAAAALDGIVLLGLDFAVLQITAFVAGVPATVVLRHAAPSMLLMFALIAALYFVLLAGLARTTVGSWAAHVSIDAAMVDDVIRLLRFRRA